MDEQQNQSFDHWCIVELMGHQRIAGRVTEVNLFGSALMRVDVPDVDNAPGFSKFFGANAIYAITPVEERIARAIAKSIDQRPVVEWELRRLLPEPEAQPSPYAEDNPDWEMYGDEDDEDTEWVTEEEARDVGDLDDDVEDGDGGVYNPEDDEEFDDEPDYAGRDFINPDGDEPVETVEASDES